MWVIYIKVPKDYYLIHQLVQLTDLILKELSRIICFKSQNVEFL